MVKRAFQIVVTAEQGCGLYVTDTEAVRGVSTGAIVQHARACVIAVKATKVAPSQDCPATGVTGGDVVPKPVALTRALDRGTAFVHVDPRRAGVDVPAWLRCQSQLIVCLGRDPSAQTRDLEIDEHGVRGTLTFSGRPYRCVFPWPAVYAVVGEDDRITAWPQDLPVAEEASGHAPRSRRPRMRLVR